MDHDIKQPPADLTDPVRQREETIQALYDLLDKNMADFDAALEGMDKAEIADMKEVSDMREIYDFIRYHYDEFGQRGAELLLRMENPLEFIVDNWPCYDLETLAMKHLADKALEGLDKEVLPQSAQDTKDLEKPSILKQIDSAGHAQQQEQMVTVLKSVLDQNMAEFHESLLRMDKEEIIAQSAEIAATQAAYDFMKDDFRFEQGDVETLLRMENPLQFIAEQWPSNMTELFDMSGQIGEAIMDTSKDAAAQQKTEQTRPAEKTPSIRSEKPSILNDLSDKKREVGQRSMAEGKAKGGEAR